MDKHTRASAKRSVLSYLSHFALVAGVVLVSWSAVNMTAEARMLTDSMHLAASIGSIEAPSDTVNMPLGLRQADTTLPSLKSPIRPAFQSAQWTRTPLSGAEGSKPAAAPRSAIEAARVAKGRVIGSLRIPAIKRTIPIIQGTDAKQLKRGAGHIIKTAMPGTAGNCVVAGHRGTVFSSLGKVKKGNRLIVHTAAGTFTYKVTRIRVVGKHNRKVTAPTKHGYLTLSTCYPFHYVGPAPRRYIVTAKLVD